MPLVLLDAVKGPGRVALPGRAPVFQEGPLASVKEMTLARTSRGR